MGGVSVLFRFKRPTRLRMGRGLAVREKATPLTFLLQPMAGVHRLCFVSVPLSHPFRTPVASIIVVLVPAGRALQIVPRMFSKSQLPFNTLAVM